ncbi:Female germline-specific tumor suppressor gld-1 [Toxocara canis]|uniref:Female germline-specific tumor suppressor gld-1 n=1 Tax=Toxocara canis TaxID=6265 RepID=A0A0B2V2I7_TOXCA|nr:Female germline-specific tumor suppressor gld-1 [Toxocara canis]
MCKISTKRDLADSSSWRTFHRGLVIGTSRVLDSSSNNISSEFTADGEEEKDKGIEQKKGEEKMLTTNQKTVNRKQVEVENEGLGGADANASVMSLRMSCGALSRFSIPPTFGTPIQKKSTPEYLAHLLEEKRGLSTLPNSFNFKHLTRLVDEEIVKVRTGLGELAIHEQTSQVVDNGAGRVQASGDGSTPKLGRRVLLQEKVFVPVHEYPDYNFVGRILGPRGMTAKQLEEETGCRIMIRGRGSTRDEGTDPQKSSSASPKEELHVLIQCEDYELLARAKLKHAVECIRLMLKPPPDGEDELKRQQLMQLAIINGTYRPTNTLKMALQNQNVLPPFSFCGLPMGVPNNGTPILAPNSTAIGNEMNTETKNVRVPPLNTSTGVNAASLNAATSLAVGAGVFGGNDAPKRFVKTNTTANTVAQMAGGTQTSSLMPSPSAFNSQLIDSITTANAWNPQLASAMINGLANSSNLLAKEYYKQMLASMNLGTSMVNGGLGMGAATSTTGSANVGLRPINLQGYLTATSMLNDAPFVTNGPTPDGEDELKRQQLMQLAIINGTYRPTNTLKMALQNQNVLPPFSFCGLPMGVPNNGTPILAPNSTAIGNEMNTETKNVRVPPLNTSTGVNAASLNAATSLAVGAGVFGGNDAPKRFVKTNTTANTVAQMAGGTQTSSLMPSPSAFNSQLIDSITTANAWNPQLASAMINGLANSSNLLAKEYYKQMLASMNLGTSMVNGGLGMGAATSTTGSANVGLRPINLQGYLTATSMLNDAPFVTNGPTANAFNMNLGTSMVNGGLGMGAATSTTGSANVGLRPINLQGYLTATSMLNDAPFVTNGPTANAFKRPH